MKVDEYRKLREDIKNSGMSIKSYCEEHELNLNSVYHAFKKVKERELPLTVIKVKEEIKRFEMKFAGVNIQIEYEDVIALRKAIKGLGYVFAD